MNKIGHRGEKVGGLLRSFSNDSNAYRATLTTAVSAVFDVASTEETSGLEDRSDIVGAWFYRTPWRVQKKTVGGIRGRFASS